MRRRQFIAGLAGAAAWPLAARAQQGDRMRRIGVLMGNDANDPEAKAWLSGFTQEISKLGWTDGRNLRMDVRWAGDSVDRMRMFAKELVDLRPDVILAGGTPGTAALQPEMRTIRTTRANGVRRQISREGCAGQIRQECGQGDRGVP